MRQTQTDLPRRDRGPRRSMLLASTIAVCMAAVTLVGTAGSASASGPTGTLNLIAGPQSPLTPNYNPFLSTSALVTVNGTTMIYEPLLQYDLAKSGVYYPWLATSYDWSDGYKTLTFDLRKGVTWSDGQPFTSADVVFTFDLLKKYPALNTGAITFSSVQAPSKYTVVFHLAAPDVPELYPIAGTTYMVPEHVWSSVKSPETYLNPNPVGTGPYTLGSESPSSLTMAANSHYWQPGLPKIANLHFTIYESNSSLTTALLAGELDWGGVAATTQFVKSYLGASKDNRVLIAPLSVQGLYLNLKQYPTDVLALREAISDALNRETISVVGESGAYPPATSPTGLVLPKDQAFLAPQYAKLHFSYSISAAKAVLKSAGFKTGSNGSLLTPKGAPVVLNLIDPSAYSDYMADTQVIKSELQPIGVSVNVEGLSISDWVSKVALGDYQATLAGPGGGPTPYYSFQQIMSSKLSAPIGQQAVANSERFNDPAADNLLNTFATSTGTTATNAMYGLEKIMVSDVPMIPLFYFADNSFFSVAHYVGWPSLKDMYEPPESIQPGNEVVALHLRPVS